MRIAILGASFDTGNHGVSVLAAGAVSTVLDRFPGCEVIFFNYARQMEILHVSHSAGTARVLLVNARFSRRLYQTNHVLFLILAAIVARLCPVASAKSWLISKNSVLRELDSSDLFLSVAGGDSFSDIYGFMRLLYVGLPQVLVLICGKKLVLLPQTIGPFKWRLSRWFARLILRKAERIFVRDGAGVGYSAAIAGLPETQRTKVQFRHDMGFVVDARMPQAIRLQGLSSTILGQSGLVGVNISGLLLDDGRRFGFSMSYRRLTEKLVETLIEKRGSKILFIPHVVARNSIDSDIEACAWAYETFAAKYPEHIGVIDGEYSYDETKYIIGKCDFFVGARMHACIAALSQCVPAAAIAYSDKFKGVMESIGCDSIIADLRLGTESEAVEQVISSYDRRDGIRLSLSKSMPQVKASIRDMLSTVS